MKQRILILGANGFIGKHVVSALARTHWATPVAGVRRAGGSTTGLETVHVDATSPSALEQALVGCSGVVNCVTGSGQVIVEGARALVRAAAGQASPPRLVHFSSMAVYGTQTGLLDESASLAGVDEYSRAKIVAEEIIGGYPRAAILRPGIVYGPGGTQWTLRIARWLKARRIGDIGPAGDGYCNLALVDDVAAVVVAALQTPTLDRRVFNVGIPEPPTWNEYFSRFGIALGQVPIAHLGMRRLKIETKLLAPPLKIAELVSKKVGLAVGTFPEAIPPSFIRLCGQAMRLDVSAASRHLGIHWTPAEKGYRASADWASARI